MGTELFWGAEDAFFRTGDDDVCSLYRRCLCKPTFDLKEGAHRAQADPVHPFIPLPPRDAPIPLPPFSLPGCGDTGSTKPSAEKKRQIFQWSQSVGRASFLMMWFFLEQHALGSLDFKKGQPPPPCLASVFPEGRLRAWMTRWLNT